MGEKNIKEALHQPSFFFFFFLFFQKDDTQKVTGSWQCIKL